MKTYGGLFFKEYDSKVISLHSEIIESHTLNENNFRNGRIIKNNIKDNFILASYFFFFDAYLPPECPHPFDGKSFKPSFFQ